MANKNSTNNEIRKHIAAIKSKFAELDALDEQFADLDDTFPEGEGVEQFDLLSEKREELETEIRKMREHVQLISDWEKFKGSGWSEDVQAELNALDQQFADIADGVPTTDGLGQPAIPDVPPAPSTPVTPEVPESPETPEVPATEPPPIEATDAPPAEPLEAPMASSKNAKINEKSNYQSQGKKGSNSSTSQKGDNHMANTKANTNKPSLKEKLAEVKNKREAITKEAKTRVASAWTIAKTMLPTAPADVQKAFAASLLTNSTKVLTAALRQTAVNAHYTKLAETFKEVHKVELNDLLEDPSVLKSEKSSVEKELKNDSKNAASKKADDRKDAGPQPSEYNDGLGGRKGFGSDFDASKAAERPDAGEKPGQTVNLSDGESKEEGKKASAKKACKDGEKCAGCENCKKHASAKKADVTDEGEAPVAEEDAAIAEDDANEAESEAVDAEDNADAAEGEADAAEVEAEAPAELPPAVPENPEAEAAEILTDEKKEVLEEKIDEALDAIKAIESEIREEDSEEGIDVSKLDGEEDIEGDGDGIEEIEEVEEFPDGEELDFSKVFDEGAMEEKAASLANEGEKAAGEEDDFFAPSAAESLEASMDDDGMADMHDMFSMQGADGDPLASLIAGLKTAEQVAGIEVVESFANAAEHFRQDEATSDDRDNESDHADTLWAETIKDIKPEEQGAKRAPQDSVNQLEKPKAATLKKIRTASGSDKTPRFDVGAALFGNDED